MILNENDYQAFVASIDLLSLHCPVCGVVGLFILDTFNKLGYKAKINTHTTSYIN